MHPHERSGGERDRERERQRPPGETPAEEVDQRGGGPARDHADRDERVVAVEPEQLREARGGHVEDVAGRVRTHPGQDLIDVEALFERPGVEHGIPFPEPPGHEREAAQGGHGSEQ